MAFPTIDGVRHTHSSSNTTSSTVLIPDGSNVVGNLLVVIGCIDGNNSFTYPGGANDLIGVDTAQNGSSMEVSYHIVDGGESGWDGTDDSFTVTHSSEMVQWTVYSISDWHGTTPPEAHISIGSSAAPNEPSFNPTGWDAEDTLWISIASWATQTRSLTAYPSGYTRNQHWDTFGGTQGSNHASTDRDANASSEDAGAYTLDGDTSWCCGIIAVRPASGLTVTLADPATTTFSGNTHAAEARAVLADPATSTFQGNTHAIQEGGDVVTLLDPATATFAGNTHAAESRGVIADPATSTFAGNTHAGLALAALADPAGSAFQGNTATLDGSDCGAPLGPGEVNLARQGTVRTADSVATIVSQIAASSAGDTVEIADGSYALVTTSKSIGSGFIRIVPETAGGVTIDGVDLSGAQGLDWRGINTTAEVSIESSASRIRWRGGTASLTSADIGFDVRDGCDDIIIEDVTATDADVSVNIQASSDATMPTNVTIRRMRSEDVAQDHIFFSRGQFVTIEHCEFFGHTDTAEHSDGVQIVGGKDSTIRRCHMWNTRTFRDNATDRNDHGVLINYDDTETPNPRVPENIRLENLLIHDQTGTGISIAGCRGIEIVNCTSYDSGASGGDPGLNMTPDTGNIIDDAKVINCVFNERVSGTVTYLTDTNNFVADNSGPTGTNKLSGDPGFVDSANQDYSLEFDSQLVDSGTTTDAVTEDIYGCPRTDPDRGAIEFEAGDITLILADPATSNFAGNTQAAQSTAAIADPALATFLGNDMTATMVASLTKGTVTLQGNTHAAQATAGLAAPALTTFLGNDVTASMVASLTQGTSTFQGTAHAVASSVSLAAAAVVSFSGKLVTLAGSEGASIVGSLLHLWRRRRRF